MFNAKKAEDLSIEYFVIRMKGKFIEIQVNLICYQFEY